jgi:hypothetical protein
MIRRYHTRQSIEEKAMPGRDALVMAKRFLYASARLVDRAAYEVAFERAPAERLLRTLGAYVNDDGGMGHALEADLRSPLSQPLHIEMALAILEQVGVRARHLAQACCEFLAGIAEPEAGLTAHLDGALDYPAAPHWQSGFGAEPSLARLCGMVALLDFHGAEHLWLDHARSVGRGYVANAELDEAHLLRYAMEFAACELAGAQRTAALQRLASMLADAAYYVAATPLTTYGLTPLNFVPRPDHPAMVAFDTTLIDRHLDELANAQQPDGGWPVRFQPPSEMARMEWCGRFAVEALTTLRAYGRL